MICEKCGNRMRMGYGLAGGGVGPYFYCYETEGCDGFEKFQDKEPDDGTDGGPKPASS